MTPEISPAPESAPEQMGAFSRLSGVFFEPKKAFEDIAKRPSWLFPLLLVIAATLAFYIAYGQHVGWEHYLQFQMDQMAANPKMAQRLQQMQQLTPEQRAMQAKFTGIAFMGSAIIITPIIFVISSAIMLAVAAMMSAGVKFKQIFAFLCWAGLPLLVKQVLAIVVMFLKNPNDFNVQNPLAFNLAAFMDPINSSKFLYTIAMVTDLFVIWGILLTATGIKAAAGKRLSYGGAVVVAAIPTVLFALLGGAVAAAFS